MSAEGVDAAGPLIITTVIVQWCSCLSACVCVNGGHFEQKFEPVIFLGIFYILSILVSVN